MQQNFGDFLRYGGNGQYVVTRRENRVIGYRSAISIKSVFPNYSSLQSDFVNRLDEVVSENSRMLLNALTSPDSAPIV